MVYRYRALADSLDFTSSLSPSKLGGLPIGNILAVQHEGSFYWMAAKAQEIRWKLFTSDFDLPKIQAISHDVSGNFSTPFLT